MLSVRVQLQQTESILGSAGRMGFHPGDEVLASSMEGLEELVLDFQTRTNFQTSARNGSPGPSRKWRLGRLLQPYGFLAPHC